MRSSRLRGTIKVMYVPGEVAEVLLVHLSVLIHKWSRRDGAARGSSEWKNEPAYLVSHPLHQPPLVLCHSRVYFRRVRCDGEIRETPLNEPCNIALRNARILKHKLWAACGMREEERWTSFLPLFCITVPVQSSACNIVTLEIHPVTVISFYTWSDKDIMIL